MTNNKNKLVDSKILKNNFYYNTFQKLSTLWRELSWNHYKLLIRIKDNPTIGIILCADKDNTVVKYSSLKDNEQLFVSKYQMYLPTAEELKAELERDVLELRV